MDNAVYFEKTMAKIKLYSQYQIFLGVNLITSFETKDQPIDSEKIERLIQMYFVQN